MIKSIGFLMYIFAKNLLYVYYVVLFSIIFFCIVGCGEKKNRLDEIDCYMEEHPDSVLRLLSCIKVSALSEEDYVHFQLMYHQARYKLDYPVLPSDLDTCVVYYHKTNNYPLLMRSLFYRGDIRNEVGEQQDSVFKDFLEARQYVTPNCDSMVVSRLFLGLSSKNKYCDDLDEGLTNALNGLRYAGSSVSVLKIAAAVEVADSYLFLGQYAKAIEYVCLAQNWWKKVPSYPLSFKSHAYRILGECYSKKGKFRLASHYFDLSVRCDRNEMNLLYQAYFYLHSDSFVKAIPLAKELEAMPNSKWQSTGYRIEAIAMDKLKDYKSGNLLEAKSDSLEDFELVLKQSQDMRQMRNDAEKKKLANEKKGLAINNFKEQEIRNSCIILLVCSVMLLLYFRCKHKRETMQLADEMQSKTQSFKDECAILGHEKEKILHEKIQIEQSLSEQKSICKQLSIANRDLLSTIQEKSVEIKKVYRELQQQNKEIANTINSLEYEKKCFYDGYKLYEKLNENEDNENLLGDLESRQSLLLYVKVQDEKFWKPLKKIQPPLSHTEAVFYYIHKKYTWSKLKIMLVMSVSDDNYKKIKSNINKKLSINSKKLMI